MQSRLRWPTVNCSQSIKDTLFGTILSPSSSSTRRRRCNRLMLLCAYSVVFVSMVVSASLQMKSQGMDERSLVRFLESSSPPSRVIQTYALWEPSLVSQKMKEWPKLYPEFMRVTTSQDAYGLPRAGTSKDCPYDEGGDGCLNYIATIQDYSIHPEGSESSKRLPEILWSGEVHGNEQVGPTAVLEAAQLLLDAATCESLPRMSMKQDIDWDFEMEKARSCRKAWDERGFTDYDRKWLARLVSSRRIVVIPTANALGYYRKVREEGNIDPNRDFPYDLLDPTQCMQTVAGRTLNEVFRDHMFQLSLTFHGGMEVIGYEWGSPTWAKSTSPDDIAQAEIAAAYSQYGGGFASSKPYAYGNMNDLVYPVRGGMEDWAYAASWDVDRVIQCEPKTFGGYPADKTVYGSSTLRVFNMLVESSNRKIPPPEMLGTSENLLFHGPSDGTKGNGYVSRNIRLSLLAAELVQPYVSFISVNELKLTDDLVPLMQHHGRSCQVDRAVKVPSNSRKVIVEWNVGGALVVDETRLWYARWSDIPDGKLDCISQPLFDNIQQYMREGKLLTEPMGDTRFARDGADGQPFAGSLDISEGFQPNDKLVVLAIARVDQSWGERISDANPSLPPQSHIVNARTNSSWYHESADKIIQGRLDWFSMPLTVVLGDFEAMDKDQTVDTVQLVNRFGDDDNGNTGQSPSPRGAGNESGIPLSVVIVVVGFIVVLIAYRPLQKLVRRRRRNSVRQFIGDPVQTRNGRGVNGDGIYYDTTGNESEVDAATPELELGEYTT